MVKWLCLEGISMDAQRFDALIRRFFNVASNRRSGLRIALATVAMALGLSFSEADAKKNGRKKKKRKKKKNSGQQDPPSDPNNQNPAIVQGECQGDTDCDRLYLKGLNCVSGQCVCKAGGNCTGCCKSGKVCVLKENQTFDGCGLGGGPCEICNPFVACNREAGKCECSPTDTCAGCCWDNNKRCSTTGTEDATCGKHTICVDCTQVGKVCQSNGTCCVPLGKACSVANPCCAGAGISCHENVCKQL
jgi:hypothetical protein